MGRGRPMVGTPEEAAERRRRQTAERVRRLRERRRAEKPQAIAPVVAPVAVRAAPQPDASGSLRFLVERIESLEAELGRLRSRNPAFAQAYAAERKAVQDELRAAYKDAEAWGFSVEALREVIRLRAIPPARRVELERTVTIYKQALGM